MEDWEKCLAYSVKLTKLLLLLVGCLLLADLKSELCRKFHIFNLNLNIITIHICVFSIFLFIVGDPHSFMRVKIMKHVTDHFVYPQSYNCILTCNSIKILIWLLSEHTVVPVSISGFQNGMIENVELGDALNVHPI